MEIDGKLRITFAKELNKAGQRPMEITFIGPGGASMTVGGVRFCRGNVLNAAATLPGGRVMWHTGFSPEMQLAIREAREKEQL